MFCYDFSTSVNHQLNNRLSDHRLSVVERGSIAALLSMVSIALIFGWMISLPAIGLPTETPEQPLEPSPSSIPSKTAKDLGEPLFPDYYNSPFGGWRSGSDQPFYLIPAEPNGRYEIFMEIPAPRQESGPGNQKVIRNWTE